MVLSWFKNPPTWAYRLLAILPALVFVAIVPVLPDVGGFDGSLYRVERYVGPLDSNLDSIEVIKNQSANLWVAEDPQYHFGVKGAREPVWYRITIPAVAHPKSLISEVGYHLLPKADFYLVDDQSVTASVFGGSERPALVDNLFTSIKFRPEQSREVYLYLRLETQAPIVAPLFIGDEQSFLALNSMRGWFHVLITGVLIGFGLYSLALFLTMRKPLYAILLVSQFTVAIFPTFFSGQIYNIWPNFTRDLSINLLIIMETVLIPQILIFFFNQSYVARDLGAKSFNNLAKIVATMTIVEFVSAPFFSSSPILIVLVTVSNLGVVAAVIIDIMKWPIKNLIFYRMFLSSVIPGIAISAASWLGVTAPSYFKHYFFDVNAVVSFILLAAAMTHRIRNLELKHRRIVRALRSDNLRLTDQLVDVDLNLVPIDHREIDVTIMYIDIMSFSLVAERDSGREIFTDLTRRLSSLSRIVTAHNGVIDRSLGDGLLCFFSGNRNSSFGHATDAFNAASEIQNMLIDEALRIKSQGIYDKDLLLPVRIGLHSDRVLLANLGGGVRVDFTMVGHGVNFVASLEQACGPFNVMISESCYHKLITSGHVVDDFAPVKVSLKYQRDLIQAYEHSMGMKRPYDMKTAIGVYFNQVGVFPRETRHSIVSERSVALISNGTHFYVLDYSPSGMRLVSDNYFAQKVVMEFVVETGVEHLNKKLRDKFIDRIIAEVKWSRKTEAGFEHGIKLMGGNQRQMELLIHVLSKRHTMPESWRTGA